MERGNSGKRLRSIKVTRAELCKFSYDVVCECMQQRIPWRMEKSWLDLILEEDSKEYEEFLFTPILELMCKPFI